MRTYKNSAEIIRLAETCRLLLLSAAIVAAPAAYCQDSGSGESKTKTNPAEKFAISPDGVDLRTGALVYNVTDLSIGNGSSSMSLVRTMIQQTPGHTNPFGIFSSNWDIMIDEVIYDVEQKGTSDGLRAMVRLGGRSETFDSNNGAVGFGHVSQGSRAILDFTGIKGSNSVLYKFTDTDGTVIEFRAIGTNECSYLTNRKCAYASRMTQPDGTIYNFHYVTDPGTPGGNARLKSVSSSKGYMISFEGSKGLVTTACMINLSITKLQADENCPSNALAKTQYEYSGFSYINSYFNNSGQYQGIPRLISVIDVTGKKSKFNYNNSNIIELLKPGAESFWVKYGVDFNIDLNQTITAVVNSQEFADGRVVTYSYQYDTTGFNILGGGYTYNTGGGASATFETPIKPGTGAGRTCNRYPCEIVQMENIVYQQTSGPTSIEDSLGRTWTLDYCNPVALTSLPITEQNRCLVEILQSVTDPEGIKTVFKYGSGRNIIEVRKVAKAGSGLADIVTKSSYDCTAKVCFAKPTSTTDANGAVTEYEYDPAHGGILRQTDPADTSGVRQVKRYSYTQRYAWLANGSGGFARAATPVWLLSEERSCNTTATSGSQCGGGAADEVVTSYDYGPDTGSVGNNLLLRGVAATANSVTMRTCYGYDSMGNRIWQTSPRAGLGGCY